MNHFPETLQNQLKNVHTYVVTPFCQDDPLQVDLDALRGNLRFLVDAGVRVVAVCGGTGEFEALSPAEYLAVSRVAQETVGQEALVVATVPGNLPVARDLLAAYASLGIQAVLAMPPLIRGQVPRDLDGVISYFRQLCAATPLAVMPYNTQSWPAEMFCRFAEIDGIIAVKDPCFQPHELYKAIRMLGTRFVWIGNKQHDPGVVQLRYQMGVEAFTSGQSNFWPGPAPACSSMRIVPTGRTIRITRSGNWVRWSTIRQNSCRRSSAHPGSMNGSPKNSSRSPTGRWAKRARRR